MVRDNQASLGTAFTVSIEARHGVSTGISAKDRATTIRAAIADDARPHDLVSPGHVFPLRARRGGVLVRTGQTEGSVDLARLAGCKPAGVICEIMKDDGEMARMPELEAFAAKHGLVICSVADLIAYRLERERIVRRRARARAAAGLAGPGEPWRAVRLRHRGRGHRVPGAGARRPGGGDRPGAVRGWRCSTRSSIRWRSSPTSRSRCGRSTTPAAACSCTSTAAPGPASSAAFGKLTEGGGGRGCAAEASSEALRDFGLGAQVLADLGLQQIRLLSNSDRKIVGIEGFGIEVVERVALASRAPRADRSAATAAGAEVR
jgi:3,4-dihydroxy 2-butanone 4-phosphate synthase/GTP cyclohydrolase II